MKFREKNDDSIELVLNPEERKLVYNALRYYSAFSEDESFVIESMGDICEIMNVLHMSGFDRKD